VPPDELLHVSYIAASIFVVSIIVAIGIATIGTIEIVIAARLVVFIVFIRVGQVDNWVGLRTMAILALSAASDADEATARSASTLQQRRKVVNAGFSAANNGIRCFLLHAANIALWK
jgi:hypothetical protein